MARGLTGGYGVRTEGDRRRIVSRDQFVPKTTRVSQVGETYEMAERGKGPGPGLTWKDTGDPNITVSRPGGRYRRR